VKIANIFLAGAASLTVIAIVIIGIYKYYLTAIITVVRFHPFKFIPKTTILVAISLCHIFAVFRFWNRVFAEFFSDKTSWQMWKRLQIRHASAHDNRRRNSCSKRTNGQRYNACFVFGKRKTLRKFIDVFLPDYRHFISNRFRICSDRIFENSVFQEQNCAKRRKRFWNEKYCLYWKLTKIKMPKIFWWRKTYTETKYDQRSWKCAHAIFVKLFKSGAGF